MYKDLIINKFIIHPNDVILFHLSEDATVNEAHEINSFIQQLFPNNTATVINDSYISKISIFSNDDNCKVKRKNPFLEDLEE